MSSSTPADSDSPGVTFSDTDATSIDEYMTERGTVDHNAKNSSFDNRLSTDDYPEAPPLLFEPEETQPEAVGQAIEEHSEQIEPIISSTNADVNSKEEIPELVALEEKGSSEEKTEEPISEEKSAASEEEAKGSVAKAEDEEQTEEEPVIAEEVSEEEKEEQIGEQETEKVSVLVAETRVNDVEESPSMRPIEETGSVSGIETR